MSTKGREQDLIEWLDGGLPPAHRAEVDAHLRGCPECRKLVGDFQNLIAGLDRLGVERGGIQVARGPMHRVAGVRWATAAAAVIALASVPFLFDRTGPRRVPPSVETPSPAAVQLAQVDMGLRSGDVQMLTRYAQSGASVPVRLAALSGRDRAPSEIPARELVSTFSTERDPVVRLWLVVAIARSGDPSAVRSIHALLRKEGESVTAEVRSAVDTYLPAATARP